jgi:hypothetical protein
MSEFEGIRRFENRSGFRLADVVDVALPVYSVNVNALTLAHKRISPIEEFVLRSIALCMSTQEELMSFLGLPVEVVRPALASLAQGDQIALAARGARNGWVLTDNGRNALEKARLVVAEERTIPIVFDALLRQVTSLKTETLLQFKQLKEEGRIEIQIHPPKRPKVEEISAVHIERLFSSLGGGVEGRRDILCIRGMDPQSIKKRFVPAIALLFVSVDSEEIQLGFVVGNQLSDEHASAFAATQGFDELITSFRKKAPELQSEAKAVIESANLPSANIQSIVPDDSALRSAKVDVAERKTELLHASEQQVEALQAKLKNAESHLAELEENAKSSAFSYLSVLDHPPLLADAVRNAKDRLLIISPWISPAVVNYEFIKHLESTLRRGVRVLVGYGISGGEEHTKPIEQNPALKQLISLSSKHTNFSLKRLGNTHAKVLIKDCEFAALTSFNWLSFRGDPNRSFRDEQGVLIRDMKAINAKFDELVLRFD